MSLYILITGANGGLGYATCQRLIDQFFHPTLPPTATLHLLLTTRSPSKGATAISSLRAHTLKHHPLASTRTHLSAKVLDLTSLASVYALADSLCREPVAEDLGGAHRWPRVDVVLLNAANTSISGINWLGAALAIPRDFIDELSSPTYLVPSQGGVAPAQLRRPSSSIPPPSSGSEPSGEKEKEKPGPSEPTLGLIFLSNTFGHYCLLHRLMPLLRTRTGAADPQSPARLIWISSLNAVAHAFDAEDVQCLRRPLAYESSKRIVDLLALTGRRLPGAAPYVREFCALPEGNDARQIARTDSAGDAAPASAPEPRMYIAHPGLACTNGCGLHGSVFLDLMFLLYTAVYYVARLLGGTWHVIDPYKGAVAPVWVALVEQTTLDAVESASPPASASGRAGREISVVGEGSVVGQEGIVRPGDEKCGVSSAGAVAVANPGGQGKWGSACDRLGRERVVRTEVEGWGLTGGPAESDDGNNGVAGKGKGLSRTAARKLGRTPKGRATTEEDRGQLERDGVVVWRYMEGLRREWEGLLGL